MRRRLLALLALCVLAAGCSTASSSPPPSTTPVSSSAGCNPALWSHVYHPARLRVLQACTTVTGTVKTVRHEPDGDVHVDLAVTDKALIDTANLRFQHGWLVVEIICAGPVTQADAVAACRGVAVHPAVPVLGAVITVTGSWVLDAEHGWDEIHPVTSITGT